MKVYFYLIPSSENDKERFEHFKITLREEIKTLSKEGYWGEEIKVQFEDNKINFGYPLEIATAIFKKTFKDVQFKLPCERKNCQHEDIYCRKDNHTESPITLLTEDKYNYRNQEHINSKVLQYINKRKNDNLSSNNCSIFKDYQRPELDATFFSNLCRQQIQGIILGEEPHGDFPSRAILLESAQHFGAKVVGLEGFFYSIHQPLFDQWYKSNNESPPIELAAWANFLEYHPPDKNKISYLNLLKAFHRNNIRILAIDDFKCWKTSDHSELRIPSLNLKVKEIINKEIAPEIPYILFVGSAHAFNTNKFGNSIKQLLPNTISLIVSKHIREFSQHLFFNFKENRITNENKYAGGFELQADVVYKP